MERRFVPYTKTLRLFFYPNHLMDPLLILGIGIVLIVGMIVFLRTNAFLALLLAALVVSFLVGLPAKETGVATAAQTGVFLSHFAGTGQPFVLEPPKKETDYSVCVTRVAAALGKFAGNVGIIIAMGSIIGSVMIVSGAADKIVLVICRLFGEKRVPAALLSSGFVLAIPVFYDATLFLLIPLARSVYRRVKKNYLLYMTAIGAGATLTHVLVPPTPGPIAIAAELHVPLATMLGVSLMIAALTAPFALLLSYFVNWYMPNPTLIDDDEIESADDDVQNQAETEKALPPLALAVLPLLLPVVLIALKSILQQSALWASMPTALSRHVVEVLGDPQIALTLGAVVALLLLLTRPGMTTHTIQHHVEHALTSAGLIVLITAAGGAFGEMLRVAGVGERIAGIFTGESGALAGSTLLLVAFGISALIKTAQGSSTVAMITTAGIVGSMQLDPSALGYNIAYLAVAIGCGSIVVGWMNDSGFWAFCRMGRISEIDAFKTWTVHLGLMGTFGVLVTILLSRLLPLIPTG